MNEDHEIMNTTTPTEGSPRWVGLAIGALAIVAIAGVAMAWSAKDHARNAEEALAAQSKALQQNNDALNQRLAQADQTNSQVQSELSLVENKLKLTEGEITAARSQVRQTRADYTKKLDDVQTSVNSQLATKANADDVTALGSDVNGVKSDLDSTKNGIQMLRTEHGELIARNHEEIDQLRRLGERDYFEFTLSQKGQKQHVGSVQVELRGASEKKHQFTLALYVDDTRLEKKNRAMDEPIYFYTNGSRVPLELVVNKVANNSISGYLSIPKTTAASAATATAAN